MIKLSNISKHFVLGNDDIAILDNINLTINEGEFVTIIGPSGSGKSTLMYLIGLLDTPTSGIIEIDGIQTSHLSDDRISNIRNEHIGFIFQQFNLITKLTVLENILLPTIYTTRNTSIDYNERAKELMERFNIDHRANSYPNKISGGEQQRVAIARALILDPKLILADEPTGNLDSKNGKIILDLIGQLHKVDKKTIIMITHDKEIAKSSPRTIQIRDGAIVK